MNGPFKPMAPGFPPYHGDSQWGCDPFPDGNSVGPVIAPAIPWLTRYNVLRRPKPLYRKGSDSLLEPDPVQRGCRYYYDVTCFADEKQLLRSDAEVFFGPESTPEQEIQGMQGARPSSQLKILLQWFEARQTQRYLIADIGTGLDVSVGPTNAVRGFLLIPDIESAPPVAAWPEGTEELLDEVTATVVTARGTMNRTGTSHIYNGRFTQVVLLGGAAPTQYVQIPAFARKVSVFPPPGTTLEARWIFDFSASSNTPIWEGGFDVPPSVSTFEVNQKAKFLALDATGPEATFATSVVFTLSF